MLTRLSGLTRLGVDAASGLTRRRKNLYQMAPDTMPSAMPEIGRSAHGERRRRITASAASSMVLRSGC